MNLYNYSSLHSSLVLMYEFVPPDKLWPWSQLHGLTNSYLFLGCDACFPGSYRSDIPGCHVHSDIPMDFFGAMIASFMLRESAPFLAVQV